MLIIIMELEKMQQQQEQDSLGWAGQQLAGQLGSRTAAGQLAS